MSRRPSAGWPRSGAAAAGRQTKFPRAAPRRRDPMPRPLIHRFLLAVSRVSLGGANQARALPPARRRHRSREEGEGRGGGGSRDGRAARNGGVPGGRGPQRRWGKSPSPASWGADSPAQAGASRARPGISARRVPVGRPRERSRGHAPTAAAPGRRPLRPGRRRQTKTQPRRRSSRKVGDQRFRAAAFVAAGRGGVRTGSRREGADGQFTSLKFMPTNGPKGSWASGQPVIAKSLPSLTSSTDWMVRPEAEISFEPRSASTPAINWPP